MSADDKRGVLEQHRERLATDPEYYAAAMTAPSITDKTGISAKYLDGTAPTVPAARAEREAAGTETPTGMIVNPPHPELSNPGQPGGDAAPAAAAPDEYDELKGDALDQAVADADIKGRASMTADEKRQALRDRAG